MALVVFCPKCGASVPQGMVRCRSCAATIDLAVAVPGGTLARPWLSIWLSPRETMRGILARDPAYLVIPIAAVAGIAQGFERAVDRNAGDSLSLVTILLICLIGGPIAGVLGLYVSAWLLRVTGGWLGGNANGEEVRAGLAWGQVPMLWGALIWLPALLLLGRNLFTSDMGAGTGESGPGLLTFVAGLFLVQFAAALWSFIVLLHCLGEVQGFSAWRALGNVLLTILLVAVPLFVLVLIVTGMR